ncbi:DUF2461 domain-containing protein [soil metagenome]
MHPSDFLPPFPGLTPEAFTFLSDLKGSNEREWFKPRKHIFDSELIGPIECLIGELSHRLPEAGVPLTADPSRAIFRIYRDTRFSKNKTPYKTHVGAYLSRSGDKKEQGGLYIHVEPNANFVGGGVWHPEPKELRRIRERIVADVGSFLAAVEEAEGAGLTVSSSEQLKRMPRGFENWADSDVAPYLKWKGIVMSRSFDDQALLSPTFTEQVVATAWEMSPLLFWMWDALELPTG